MGVFGPSKKETYQNLADNIDAQYIDAGAFKGGVRVEKGYKFWTIYLDTFTVSTGKSSTTYTRIRAPFVGQFDFRFKIGRVNVFTRIAKAFGKQYVASGDYVFDDEFYIKSNDEEIVKDIFINNNLKTLLKKIKRVSILVKKAGGRDIYDEYELNYTIGGVLKDVDILKDMFEVFELMLDEFAKNNIAKDEKAKKVLFK